MPALFVVNPSKRAKRSGAKPMARRATSRRRRKTSQVAIFRANPVRRRRRRVTRRRAFASNPAPIRRRRRRVGVRRFARNPSRRRALMGGALNVGKMLLPAIGIGVGAVGSEVIMGYLPIPANFKTGVLRHVTKGAVGITAGMIISKFLKQPRIGNAIALGAIVIATHDALKEVISARMPSVPFGAYLPRGSTGGSLGYYSPAMAADMGMYVATSPGGLHGYEGGQNPDFQA